MQEAGQGQAVAAVVARAAQQQDFAGLVGVEFAKKPPGQGPGGALHQLHGRDALRPHGGLVELVGLGGGEDFHGAING
ncbi:hypothetical protein BEN49_18395 [Hymenobacter coccineus]|uniref:Uncharacterized protein n=1 Tax=Hymenobacter coccineus TaxID=1908235 RepID=A0A1G1TLU5_9BACT|nr:hypothetical protein BEN49_18395 [Hymenobacter coccineus]